MPLQVLPCSCNLARWPGQISSTCLAACSAGPPGCWTFDTTQVKGGPFCVDHIELCTSPHLLDVHMSSLQVPCLPLQPPRLVLIRRRPCQFDSKLLRLLHSRTNGLNRVRAVQHGGPLKVMMATLWAILLASGPAQRGAQRHQSGYISLSESGHCMHQTDAEDSCLADCMVSGLRHLPGHHSWQWCHACTWCPQSLPHPIAAGLCMGRTAAMP